jgi:hypothetical protein
MDTVIKIFQDTDIGLLISLVILGWIFYSRLNFKMDKMEMRLDQRISTEANRLDQRITNEANKLDQRMDRLEARMDKFDEKLTDIDRRLWRMEGAVMFEDCYMLKNEDQLNKAE